eukprot:157918_1
MALRLSKPSLQSYLIRRSTTDKLLDGDCTFEAEVGGTPPSPKTKHPSPLNRANNARASRRGILDYHNSHFGKQTTQPPLNHKGSGQSSAGYGATKCREIKRQFQLAEQKFIIFLRSIISNIIHPLRMMFLRLRLNEKEMSQFNIIFDICLSLYRFHASALHKLSSHRKKSGSRSKAPIFNFYAQFPTFYATYFEAAFKAVTQLQPIITSHPTLKQWFGDKCCSIMLLYDNTMSTPYESLAEILRDISTHCVEQSKKLQDLAVSKHFIMNKEARMFRKKMQQSLENSYLKKWNTEYKQKFDLMHLEMTLTCTAPSTVSELKTAEDQCSSELDKLNQQMMSLKNDFKVYQKILKKEKEPPLPQMTQVSGLQSVPEMSEANPSMDNDDQLDEEEQKQFETALHQPEAKVVIPSRPMLIGDDSDTSKPAPGGLMPKPQSLDKPSLMRPPDGGLQVHEIGFKRSMSIKNVGPKRPLAPPMQGGLKIAVSKFKYKSRKNLLMRGKSSDDPTPVTDKAMFKYFKQIDMGKCRIDSADMNQDPLCFDMSYSPSPSPGPDGQWNFLGSGDEEEEDEHGDLSTDYDDSDDNSSQEEEEEENDSDEDSDEYDSDDYSDDDDDDGFSFMAFLTEHAQVERDTVYASNGYKMLHKMCNTLQGELLKALEMSSDAHVVIKKADRQLVADNLTIVDEVTCVVTENRIKEAKILKYLTSKEMGVNQYIVKYFNFFESDDDCYLVMEVVHSGINLKQFVMICTKYIRQKKMKKTEYRSTIKRLYWQLALTIDWLHNTMHCCHLDLCLSNIMLKDCGFVTQPDGYLTINPETSIKLCDFGVAEIFADGNFECTKQDLSIENNSYYAPQVVDDEIYDARAADMWSMGMLLYFIVTGERLYEPMEAVQTQVSSKALVSTEDASLSSLVSKRRSRSSVRDSLGATGFLCNGYWALHNGTLKEYLTINEQVDRFEHASFRLMLSLLRVKESKRLTATKVLKHKWFKEYYRKHEDIINNQPTHQQVKQALPIDDDFPFYEMF